MHEGVSPGSRALVASAIKADDRVLVLGAGGWFGRTTLDLLGPLSAEVLAIASSDRLIHVGTRQWRLQRWHEPDVARFDATVVIDCAFLTRDRIASMPLSDYVETNRELTRRMITASVGANVRLALTISSGAAVFPTDAIKSPLEDNPYGYLKREAELQVYEVATSTRSVVIPRAWSVSGAHIQHPGNYALADMILQARRGAINVTASTNVFRRYVLADELLTVSLASTGSGVIDSGGDLVEMGELAEAVRAVVQPDAVIFRPDISGDGPAYYSDNESWNRAVSATSLSPTSLAGQIRITARGLLHSDPSEA